MAQELATRGGPGMISDGDSVAKNAFRVALLNDRNTPPSAEDPLSPTNRTQELDPNDILEVCDMAEAIARAEQIVSAPRSSRPSPCESDLFESLGHRPTDDTAGPATPAPSASAMLTLRPEARVRPPAAAATLSAPAPAPAPTPAHELVLSLPSTEEDAYFAPAPRIRSLADQTLDGYRPEPTLLLRARARRSSFKWVLGAVLLPLLVLSAIAVFGRQDTAPAATSTTTSATATVPVAPPATTKPTAGSDKPVATSPATSPGVPVFDVNSLPTAKPRAGH